MNFLSLQSFFCPFHLKITSYQILKATSIHFPFLTLEHNKHHLPQLVFELHLRRNIVQMKKTHIVLLVLIAISIAVLISFMGDVTTYDTVTSAKEKPGKFVHLIAKMEKNTMEYDPVKNPNFLSFTAVDSIGNSIKVVYHNTKPTDIEKSERLVLKGKVEGDHFECRDILLKCPSKYKDDMNAAKKELRTAENNPKAGDVTAAETK